MPEPINTAWSDASLGAAVARINLLGATITLDLVSALQAAVIASIQARETLPLFLRRIDRLMLGQLRVGVHRG